LTGSNGPTETIDKKEENKNSERDQPDMLPAKKVPIKVKKNILMNRHFVEGRKVYASRLVVSAVLSIGIVLACHDEKNACMLESSVKRFTIRTPLGIALHRQPVSFVEASPD